MAQPDLRDFQAGGAGPLAAGRGAGDGPAGGENLIQTDLAGVALGDGVGSNEGALASRANHPGGFQEKIGAEVGAAALAGGEVFNQIFPIIRPKCTGDALASLERRIANECIETVQFPVMDCTLLVNCDKDLRKSQRPVERRAVAEQAGHFLSHALEKKLAGHGVLVIVREQVRIRELKVRGSLTLFSLDIFRSHVFVLK